MKSTAYVYGVETVNGYDAWSLFEACAAGDLGTVNRLLAKDRRLVNAQHWYQVPIHNAVRRGTRRSSNCCSIALPTRANRATPTIPGTSLLLCAQERGYVEIETVLRRALKKRFHYMPEFEELKQAIIARNGRRVGVVVRRRPDLIAASDALGNNALHWSVITRQMHLIERFAPARHADRRTARL
jgi:hypothetical protein